MKTRLLIGILALCLTGSPSNAFVLLDTRWLTAETTVFVDIPEFAQRSDWSQSFIAAAALWSPDFSITIQPSYADPCETGIARNGVDFKPNICDVNMPFGAETLAVAVTTSLGGGSIESDIIFNSTKQWDIYSGPEQSAHDFGRVAVHELGHLIGLDHEDTVPAIMSAFVGDIEAPTDDDRAGVQAIYGAPFIPPLIAVAGPRNFIPIGPQGGPFAPSEQEYRIYNLGTEDMTYGVFWPMGEFLDVQDSTGSPFTNPRVLSPGSSTSVKYILNGNATALSPTIFTLLTTIANLSNNSGDVDIEAEIRVNISSDLDLDGTANGEDLCPLAVDTGLDSGGVGGATPDGIGDGCQCGDVSDDGIVDILDALLVIRDQAALLPGLNQSIKCSVDGVSGCSASDAAAIRTVLTGVGSLQQSCTAETGTP